MKFAIATLFTLALAMSVECSVIGLGWGHAPHASVAIHAAASPWLGVSHGGWDGTWDGHSGAWNGAWDGAWDGAWNGHSGAWNGHSGAWDGAWNGHNGAWDGAWSGHGHHAAVVVAGPHHGGSYVAKTRGAVHATPLAGHIASAAAINVAPAPGTH